VYVEEAPSSAPPIHTLPTSIAAFIGRTPRGPTNEPILITSVLDYARIFGGLRQDSTVAYAVRHYFENGGRQAIVVRVHNDAVESTSGTLASAGAGSGLELQAEIRANGVIASVSTLTMTRQMACSISPFASWTMRLPMS
jgi:phage tail sheath protein FI